MIPPICEPILAGIFVSLFNKYILNNINSSVLCCKSTHETTHEIANESSDQDENSSPTTSINSDISNVHIHVVH